MNTDLSIFHLVKEASVVVQIVMAILMIASLSSWTFIFSKRRELNRAIEITDEFEEQFWSGTALTELYKKLAAKDFEPEGIEKIFLAGYREFSRMRQTKTVDPSVQVESAQRAMRIELSRELERLDEHLAFLATVGSTSPYVGLFGTVWGIMNSFMSLGNVKQATLAQVAPGIAEALIATAIGLFAAIPAVIAYNRFSTRLDRLTGRYELFVEEFVVLLQRQAHSKP
jgi:biopolymer transport protein TolQ